VPLPFFRSVAAVAVARENGIALNVFPLPFCRCRTAVWDYGRTAKIGFDPICYGMGVTAQWQVGTATAQRIFFYVGNVILTALTEFLRNHLCNGNGKTAERQNGTLETRY